MSERPIRGDAKEEAEGWVKKKLTNMTHATLKRRCVKDFFDHR